MSTTTLKIRVDDEPVVLRTGENVELAAAEVAKAQQAVTDVTAQVALAQTAETGAVNAKEAIEASLNLDPKPTGITPLTHDAAGNVTTWLDGGLLDAAGLGPSLVAAIGGVAALPLATDGRTLKRYRGMIASLRGTSPTVQLHHLMTGDSWTERYPIPQAFADAYRAAGFSIVATGWVGVQSTGKTNADGSKQLLDTAELTITNGSTADASEDDPISGEYAPDGLRCTFAETDTAAGFELDWTGKTLDLWFTANGGKFSYQTDGGAVTAVTLGSGGGVEKVTITAAAEGAHTTIMTRPDATLALTWFGGFAGSELPGVIISKMGNGNSRMEEIAACLGTTSAAILADLLPDATVGTTNVPDADGGGTTAFDVKRRSISRLMWLTNDARDGDNPVTVKASLATIVAAFRAGDADAEIIFAIPPDNGSTKTGNRPIGDYVPDIFDQAATDGFEVEDYYTRWPEYEDGNGFVDTLHLAVAGGWPKAMATQEFADFGGLYL